MDTPDPEPKAPRDPIGQILIHEGRSLALVDLGSSFSDTLRAAWRDAGEHPHESGGIIESAWLLPALGGAGTASSSLLAGNVFLATANPATLMTIGTGVGSAVMGPAGIVAQAPFVAASTALTPVVAPLMLFATVAAVVTGARLDRVQRGLGRLSDAVDRLQRVLNAKDYARFETAASLLDGLGSEFARFGHFGTGDTTTLELARQTTNELRAQFGQLAEGPVTSEDDARNAVADLNRFFLATILDLQSELLRVYLALQEDSERVEHRQLRLRQKIERCVSRFHEILDADRVGDFHRRFKEERAATRRRKWLGKLPPVLRRRLLRKADPALQRVEAIRMDDHAVRARIAEWIHGFETAADEARQHSIIVYREPDGERPFRAVRTREVRLEPDA